MPLLPLLSLMEVPLLSLLPGEELPEELEEEEELLVGELHGVADGAVTTLV